MQFNFKEKLTERFLRYAAVESQSQAGTGIIPSSKGQMELAELLKRDLQELQLTNIKLTEQAILTAKLEANLPRDFIGKPQAIGFLAHLDTVNMSISPMVKPQIIKDYDGKDVLLNEAQDIWLKTDEHKEILKYCGQDIIVTDGTSVLGADNKAAVASIMVALEYFKSHPEVYHGDIHIAFVPDEEIGLVGAKALDLDDFPVSFAYTIDSCELGEVVYETFNAASVVINIQGITAHPMSAKGVLVNPILIANDIINHFDKKDTPEYTEDKEGYFWVTGITGNQNIVKLNISIRDHNKDIYEQRKNYIVNLMKLIKEKHSKAKITYEITDTYSNISDSLNNENKKCIDYIFEAMEKLEITPKVIAMRGGTDGSALSARGIPTPNFFTGAHNFHSNCEFLPLGSFEKSCLMILGISNLVYKTK